MSALIITFSVKMHILHALCSGGLRPMDIITKINGKEVTSSSDVYSAVETGQDLKVTIHRGHQIFTLTVNPEYVD